MIKMLIKNTTIQGPLDLIFHPLKDVGRWKINPALAGLGLLEEAVNG